MMKIEQKALILTVFAIILAILGLLWMHKRQNSDKKVQTGALASALADELNRYGCNMEAVDFQLLPEQAGWRVDRGDSGVLILVEGDVTHIVFEAFKGKFGKPAGINSSDSNGGMSFQYTKRQCGVVFFCGAVPGPASGRISPQTTIGIYSNVALP